MPQKFHHHDSTPKEIVQGGDIGDYEIPGTARTAVYRADTGCTGS
jgi:hypothetical protein